jgi:hypothetical protein
MKEISKMGKKKGKGIFTWPQGDKYEGEFENGKRHGEGSMYFEDGTWYVGHWERGKMNGYGTLYAQGGQKLEGEWVDNVLTDVKQATKISPFLPFCTLFSEKSTLVLDRWMTKAFNTKVWW